MSTQGKTLEIMNIWNRFSGPGVSRYWESRFRRRFHPGWSNKILEIQKQILFIRLEWLAFYHPEWQWEKPRTWNTLAIWKEHITKAIGVVRNDLDKIFLPCILFCHQGIDNSELGIENGMRVRIKLESANKNAGFHKVQIVLSGDHHQEIITTWSIGSTIQINSMSYHWQGSKYAQSPYSKVINKEYPFLKYMAHYKDPLWALVVISANGILTSVRRELELNEELLSWMRRIFVKFSSQFWFLRFKEIGTNSWEEIVDEIERTPMSGVMNLVNIFELVNNCF